jgi:hypothetical protein
MILRDNITVSPAVTTLALTSGGQLTSQGTFSNPAGMSLALTGNSGVDFNASKMTPVKVLTARSSGGEILFRNSGSANTGQGVLATGGIVVSAPAGRLNTPDNPLVIDPGTPSLRAESLAPGGIWFSSPFIQLVIDFSGSMQSETDRFIRTQLRQDAGVLPVENLVLFGGATIDTVVAPLSFPSLLIRLPDCLEAQRNGEGKCPGPRR